jgi:hypothetical protein
MQQEHEDEWRARLTIFNDDVHVTFFLKRDGNGAGKVAVIKTGEMLRNAVYHASARQQRWIVGEITYRLLQEDDSASFESITAWLNEELEHA